jgi:hypothetical protein
MLQLLDKSNEQSPGLKMQSFGWSKLFKYHEYLWEICVVNLWMCASSYTARHPHVVHTICDLSVVVSSTWNLVVGSVYRVSLSLHFKFRRKIGGTSTVMKIESLNSGDSVNDIYWINCMSYNNSTYIGIRKQVTQHLYKFFSQIPKKEKKRKIHVRWIRTCTLIIHTFV